MVTDWLSVSLAAVAIVVAVGTFVKQHRLQSRVAGIEEERRAEEVSAKLQADVTAAFTPRTTSRGTPGKSFTIVNRGPAPASTVRFDMEPVGDGAGPLLVGYEENQTIPLLDVDSPYTLPAEFVLGSASAVDIHLKWADDSGEREKTIRLSTFG